MPRIMGIGNLSKLGRRHKPKKAGSFKGLGVIIEGSPSKSRKYGGVKGVRGTPAQHAGDVLQHKRTLDKRMSAAAGGSCKAAMMAIYSAGRYEEAAKGANPQGSIMRRAAERAAIQAQQYVLQNCGCRSKKK